MMMRENFIFIVKSVFYFAYKSGDNSIINDDDDWLLYFH